jgi:hypothetical protein
MFVTIASSEVSTSVTENTDKEIQLHVHMEPTVWYFGIVPTVCYFGIVPTVWYVCAFHFIRRTQMQANYRKHIFI